MGGVDGQAGQGKESWGRSLSMTRVAGIAELEDYRYRRKKPSRSGRFGIESYVTGPPIKS